MPTRGTTTELENVVMDGRKVGEWCRFVMTNQIYPFTSLLYYPYRVCIRILDLD